VVVLATGAAIVLAVAAPRGTVAPTVLAVLFVRPLEHLVQVSAVGYLDEALVALCLVTLPLRHVIDRNAAAQLPRQVVVRSLPGLRSAQRTAPGFLL